MPNPRIKLLTDAQERTLIWIHATQDDPDPAPDPHPYEKLRIRLRPAVMEALRLQGVVRNDGSLTLHGQRVIGAIMAEPLPSYIQTNEHWRDHDRG